MVVWKRNDDNAGNLTGTRTSTDSRCLTAARDTSVKKVSITHVLGLMYIHDLARSE